MDLECKASRKNKNSGPPKPMTPAKQKQLNDLLKLIIGMDPDEEERKKERAKEKRRLKRLDKVFEKTVLDTDEQS